ncbi:hypothetical protein C8Q79DRAFT_387509 [Trametes meyenii]|nr:hypothetical protein C8Q79DRAFT_387509 [Trametes meyenii]
MLGRGEGGDVAGDRVRRSAPQTKSGRAPTGGADPHWPTETNTRARPPGRGGQTAGAGRTSMGRRRPDRVLSGRGGAWWGNKRRGHGPRHVIGGARRPLSRRRSRQRAAVDVDSRDGIRTHGVGEGQICGGQRRTATSTAVARYKSTRAVRRWRHVEFQGMTGGGPSWPILSSSPFAGERRAGMGDEPTLVWLQCSGCADPARHRFRITPRSSYLRTDEAARPCGKARPQSTGTLRDVQASQLLERDRAISPPACDLGHPDGRYSSAGGMRPIISPTHRLRRQRCSPRTGAQYKPEGNH